MLESQERGVDRRQAPECGELCVADGFQAKGLFNPQIPPFYEHFLMANQAEVC